MFRRHDQRVTCGFTPVLKAYIVCDHEEDGSPRSETRPLQPVWEADLLKLDSLTTIVIKEIPQGGFVAHAANEAESSGE